MVAEYPPAVAVVEHSPTVQVAEDSPTVAVTEETHTVVVTGETPANAATEATPTDMDSKDQGDATPNPLIPNVNSTITVHQIFYRNQNTDAYKIVERVIQQTVCANVLCINPNDNL